MPTADPKAFGDTSPISVPLGSGIIETPSRFSAPFGSLSACRNFEVVDGAYEETQGLTLVGPTLSDGLVDFWHADIDVVDAATTGTFQTGDYLYWYGNDGQTTVGSGRIYYASVDGSECILTVDRISGETPRRASELYSSTGATLSITGNSALADTFTYQTLLDLSWSDYTSERFLGSMLAEQKIQSDTWDAFKPDPLGVQGISGVFQLNDNVYATRDFLGGRFVEGEEEPKIGHVVSVGTFSAAVGGYKLTSGSWEEGDAEGVLHLYPTSTTALDMSTVEDWDDSATITNDDTGNTLGATVALGEKTYSNKGLLWKLDSDSRQGGWSLVDVGYSLSFHLGEVAPLATVAPLITTESLESVTDTGNIDLSSPATEYPSGGSLTSWSGLGNMQAATPGVYAASTVTASNASKILEFNLKDASEDVVSGDARILGIEVSIKAHQVAGTDARIIKVQLRNDATDAMEYLSADRGDKQALDTDTGVTYIYGDQLDLFGFKSISQEDINNGDIKLLVQVDNSNTSSSRVVNIDEIQLKVHYASTGQKVYLYDGATDLGTAYLYAYQVFDGDWSTDDATGWMTLYNLTNPSAITAGIEIRSEPAGGGDFIAYTQTLTKNFLPSLEEMDARNAIYQSRTGTFSGNENSEAVYVATGVSPAFVVDKDDKFSFIRLPIDQDKDLPRYVEIHRSHLCLATGSHLLVSSIGAPNNFDTYDGATTWSLKDRVTGLAAAPDGTTMIVCDDSIHLLQGSGASGQDTMAVRVLTDNSGARDYTITNLLGNIFVDYAGLTTADVSDKFGGFDLGRRSGHARPTLQKLLGTRPTDTSANSRIIGAIPVRQKNQYRVYFADGEILTATFPEDPMQPLAFTQQNYTAYFEDSIRGYEAIFAPTALDSSVLTTGEESILIGTRIGHVMKVDPKYLDILSYANRTISEGERKDTLQIWKFFKFLDLNPLHADDPSQAIHHKRADVYLEHSGYARIARAYKTDYDRFDHVPVISATEDNVGPYVTVGNLNSYPATKEEDYFSWYLDEMTDGLVIRLSKLGGYGSRPVRISSMLMHASPKGDGADNIHRTHAYPVRPSVIPDKHILGSTMEAVAEMVTPSVTTSRIVNAGTMEVTGEMVAPTINTGASLWTWDTEHFTLDDDTNHTFDGYHIDP